MPVDDGAADHLPGSEVPAVALPSTLGGELDLAEAARERLVVYVYPRTGVPGQPLLDGWDDIPGARGCTPQSCAFRDAQRRARPPRRDAHRHQRADAGRSRPSSPEREHIPYPLLSDHDLELADAMGLPTFETSGLRSTSA